jgi:superfamily I DNA/RNA helicase
MIPSKYQQDIFDFTLYSNGNAVVNAVAGSGKTTTILECIKLIPQDKKILFLAFNKHIVNELEKKISAPNVDIMTTHKYGWKTLTYHYKNISFDENKIDRYIAKFKNKQNFNLAKIKTIINYSKIYLTEDHKYIQIICYKHGIEVSIEEIKYALQILKVSSFDKSCFDWTDMVWQPLYNKLHCKWYDWVFIDECQDLNKAQQELILKALSPDGRFIAVGDPYQSIYGFNGADPESFERLKLIKNTKEFPLSICYRCDKEIIKEAQKICPNITYAEDAENGEVSYKANLDEVQNGDWILCRNLAPLIVMYNKLKSENLNVVFNGIDIKDELNKIINGVDDQDFINEKIDYKKEYLLDKIDLLKLVELSHNDAIDCINNHQKNSIVLSTIHKAKGLEANNIYIVNPELIGSQSTQHWEYRQEQNLLYVAITRAKNKLNFLKC